MAKYIFVTGGVVSSVGKGITVASIGRILKSYNISVSVQKLDPYLNVDPGTMSPYQHGEVYVTEDGAETDLDLGHYERFIDINLSSASSVTSGQVYSSVIAKERRGDFLGGTIQVVPHVTNEIKHRIHEVAKQRRLLVIEDCAQAFAGRQYHGHPDSDVSMFSFGPIKTATALWGAVLRVRDPELLERMRARQADYPIQTRRTYLRRLLKYAALKAFSTRPVFGAVMRACRVMGRDHDQLINGSVRGFRGEDLLARIRQQPSTPLLALLARRLRTFNSERLADRASKGELLVELLKDQVACPGATMAPHTHWVFPVLVDDPDEVIALLRQSGYDATQGQSLCVVAAPAERPELDPTDARDVLEKVVFLPLYPEMPKRAVRKMARVLLRGNGHSLCESIDHEPPSRPAEPA